MFRTFDALGEFFTRLGRGDSVAIGILVAFLIAVGLAGLIVLWVKRNLRKEEEEWARRRGRLPRK